MCGQETNLSKKDYNKYITAPAKICSRNKKKADNKAIKNVPRNNRIRQFRIFQCRLKKEQEIVISIL